MAKSFFERLVESIGNPGPFSYGSVTLDNTPGKYESIVDKTKAAFAGGNYYDDDPKAGAAAFDAEKSERRGKRKQAEAAKKSIVTEVAEEPVETTPATTTTPAATTTTPAVQSVLQDVEIGLKGDTIQNKADIPSQGIPKSDKTGLRPKRSVRRVGMLASYQPGASQSLLASA